MRTIIKKGIAIMTLERKYKHLNTMHISPFPCVEILIYVH